MRYALLLLLLAGCMTPEQIIAKHAPFCEKLGYTTDTDPWRQCIQTEAGNDKAARSRIGAAALQSRPKTCNPNATGGVTCY